jgi:hypothetical protein
LYQEVMTCIVLPVATRELVRPVLPERRRPRFGPVAAGVLLVVLTAGWALASRSDAGGVRVERTRPADVDAAYRDATGAVPAPRTGSPACARGKEDERSWARPDTPAVVAGRYTCRIVDGRAVMWWTEGNELVRATGADGDLAALFAWWQAQAG